MKLSNHSLIVQSIPLDKLKKCDENVRKVPHTKEEIEALANSIEAHGQIQNLVVKSERDGEGSATGCYLVIAGEGRRLAQLLRVKCKKIKADHPIACLIDDSHSATAVSLAENDLRRPSHPVDQLSAFKVLADAGQSIDEIAAQFSVTPLIVKQRLKLANVAPEFIELYRTGKAELSVLLCGGCFVTTDAISSVNSCLIASGSTRLFRVTLPTKRTVYNTSVNHEGI